MTHRQVRATFVLAAFIAVAGILSAVLTARRTVEVPVEVGVIVPEPIVADTTADSDSVPHVVKKERSAKSADTAISRRDSPLYHTVPRDDLR